MLNALICAVNGWSRPNVKCIEMLIKQGVVFPPGYVFDFDRYKAIETWKYLMDSNIHFSYIITPKYEADIAAFRAKRRRVKAVITTIIGIKQSSSLLRVNNRDVICLIIAKVWDTRDCVEWC